MTIERHILVGRDVYTRDDREIGEIKGVTADAEFVVVARPLSRDLLVPMEEIREAGGRLETRHDASFLDGVPEVEPEHLTVDDRRRLEEFYRSLAA
jgi:hypothetical protein